MLLLLLFGHFCGLLILSRLLWTFLSLLLLLFFLDLNGMRLDERILFAAHLNVLLAYDLW